MNNIDILILGNGFDKLHGVNSTYKDFLKFLRDEKKEVFKKNKMLELFSEIETRDSWVDCENILCMLFNGFAKFKEDKGESKLDLLQDVESEYFLRYMDKTFFNIATDTYGTALDFTDCYDLISQKEYLKVNNEKIINYDEYVTKFNFDYILLKMNDDYLSVRMELLDYLKQEEQNFIVKEKISGYLKNIALENSLVITFNYTNTFSSHYHKGDIVHIHGNLVDDTIVFGHYDCNVNICNKKDQLFCLNTASNFKSIFKKFLEEKAKVNELNIVNLHIIGHSIDKNDRQIYETIEQELEKLKSRKNEIDISSVKVSYTYYDNVIFAGPNQMDIIENMKSIKLLNNALNSSNCKGYNTYDT